MMGLFDAAGGQGQESAKDILELASYSDLACLGGRR